MIVDGVPYIEMKKAEPFFSIGRKKLAGLIAGGSLIASLAVPGVFADTIVTMTNNGSGSDNTVQTTETTSQSVTQSNTNSVSTTVDQTANSGGNHANDNTNGTVDITTGTASNSASVSVAGGSNDATLGCGCNGTTDVLMDANGTDTTNVVTTSKSHTQTFSQGNSNSVGTAVTQRARSGRNRANRNTGGTNGGGVSITTDGTSNTSSVSTTSSSNTLNVSLSPTPGP